MRRMATTTGRVAAVIFAASFFAGAAHAQEAPAEASEAVGSPEPEAGVADAPTPEEAAAQATASVEESVSKRPGALAEAQPTPLFELLDLVEQGLEVEREENRLRIEQFIQRRADQERLLAEARAVLAQEEALSDQMEVQYNENEAALAENEELLKEQLGQLGELFGVVRQVATDASGILWDSAISAQLGQRNERLDRLGRSTKLPSTEDLQKLWFELHQEMTEQGQVVRFRTPVLTLAGRVEERDVVRAGPFSTVSNGRYLLWEPAQGKLRELTRQPPARYLNTAGPFEETTTGVASLAVDPSRGSLLNALTDTPNFTERVQQGGYVGYVIISLGLFALLLGLVRWAAVSITSRKVRKQIRSDTVNLGNPLGRVLSVLDENRAVDSEMLELKLDEAVLRESSKLERYLWIVKTVSVVAPLLGLLGTVTGMIQTFQAITLFGAGDPKMMAGGISEALVTTMLGLMTAIPLVLLSDTLSNSTQRIMDILDEQSAGLIAMRAEDSRA
jgi:biopolymer transport protein ExbB